MRVTVFLNMDQAGCACGAFVEATKAPPLVVSGKTATGRSLIPFALRRGAQINPTALRFTTRTDEMQISEETHDKIAAELHRAALILVGGHGVQPHEILAVALGWLMTQMADQWGPEAAAECARTAAKRLEALPPRPQLATCDGVPVRVVQ